MRHDSGGHGGHGHSAPDPIKPGARYETQDVSIATMIPWLFGLFAFAGISAFITYLVMYIYVPDMQHKLPTSPPVAQARRGSAPEEPRLQVSPLVDIQEFRKSEQLAAENYSQDPTTHEIHIPVQRVIDLLYPPQETSDAERLRQEVLPTRAHPGDPDISAPNEPSHAEGQAEAGAPTGAPPADATTTNGLSTSAPNSVAPTKPSAPGSAEPEGRYPSTSGANDNLP